MLGLQRGGEGEIGGAAMVNVVQAPPGGKKRGGGGGGGKEGEKEEGKQLLGPKIPPTPTRDTVLVKPNLETDF